MKITVDTVKLKEMMSRAMKGVGNNKLLPMTELMWIYVKSKTLTLVTTDGTNYLYIKDKGSYDDKFDTVVPVDKLNKLVQRMTSDNITLEVENNIFKVYGNGVYSIELILDGDKPIKYVNPMDKIKLDDKNKLSMVAVRNILASLKSALAVDMSDPSLVNYYVGSDAVLATNSYILSCMKVALFGGTETLVAPTFMNLLDVITEETATYACTDKYMVVATEDCAVYGGKLDGIEDYPVDMVERYIDLEFDYSCKIDKNTLLATLDRMSLFVGDFGDTSANLVFSKNGAELSTNDRNSSEVLPYVESDKVEEFACKVDIALLIPQIKAYSGNVVEIQYGTDECIKLANGDTTQVISLVDEEAE